MRIGRETLAVYTFFLTEPFKLHFSFALTSNSNVYVASAVILMEIKYVISSSFSNAIYKIMHRFISAILYLLTYVCFFNINQ